MHTLNAAIRGRVRKALEASWSEKTSFCFQPGVCPSYGQCGQTAIVIQKHFGGEILQTPGWGGKGLHFYNRIGGERVDFTADQFTDIPGYTWDLVYEDAPSSVQLALADTYDGQVLALDAAFTKALESLLRD